MEQPTILVADDMPLNFIPIQDLLECAGCRSVFVSNGSQAVEKFLLEDYQLILLDVRMPVMDGLDATRLIRRHEQTRCAPGTKRTPVVILSASPDDRREAREAGCDDYLLKPLDRDLLLGTLLRYVGVMQERRKFIPPATGIPPAVAGCLCPGIG